MANMRKAAASFNIDTISIDYAALGQIINDVIADVSQLRVLSKEDLKVYSTEVSKSEENRLTAPTDLKNAVESGTKFFDALIYFSLSTEKRPSVVAVREGDSVIKQSIAEVKTKLLWMALFIMIRGNYPSSGSSVVGADVPAFLATTCGMKISPKALAESLASFELEKLSLEWIRAINWSGMHQSIQQRLALGLAGYRLLGPFKILKLKAGVSDEVKRAYQFVQSIANQKPDYSILSATRSPNLVAKLGSFNNALSDLMFHCFTTEDLQKMKDLKVLYKVPVEDLRYRHWISWAADLKLDFTDPIFPEASPSDEEETKE